MPRSVGRIFIGGSEKIMTPVTSENPNTDMIPSWGNSGRIAWNRGDDEVALISLFVAQSI